MRKHRWSELVCVLVYLTTLTGISAATEAMQVTPGESTTTDEVLSTTLSPDNADFSLTRVCDYYDQNCLPSYDYNGVTSETSDAWGNEGLPALGLSSSGVFPSDTSGQPINLTVVDGSDNLDSNISRVSVAEDIRSDKALDHGYSDAGPATQGLFSGRGVVLIPEVASIAITLGIAAVVVVVKRRRLKV
jgi:hypothetical protein